jgi:hypothetical protein
MAQGAIKAGGRIAMAMEITRRGFLGASVGIGVGFAAGMGRTGYSDEVLKEARLLHRIDCTQDFPVDRFFAHGDTLILDTPLGRYREAEGKPLSRFGYRFSIEHVGAPHVAVIHYPDDKRRFMCIMDGTGYDLTTGVFTGWAQPLSGTMLELRQIFWPRWQDCSIVFTTWGEGEPAAAASIEIYELPALPPLEVAGDPLDGTRREIGIQYEDPCGTGASEGARNREEWIDHVVQYMRHSGQSLLAYPMVWYEGPQFPSGGQPSDGFDVVVAPDRKQYARWTTHPEDWYAKLLERFEKEGLAFQGALTLMRLGRLLDTMNIDMESIKAGADTYNNVLWNNHVQASTNDWTPFYNAVNYFKVAENLKGKAPAEPSSVLPQYAYRETRDSANHTGPIFNPLHPVVQQAILLLVQEIGARYAKYRSFKGISFNMFAACMPWFGSIHFGYDDFSIGQFEKDTGIAVPVDPKAPDRFSRRYEYLMYVCKPAWVAWRCARIRALFGEIHKTLAAIRADLRVTVTLWDETVVSNTLGPVGSALQLGARKNMHQLYREAGIDIDLFADAPAGLEVDRGMGNSRDRGGHGSNPAGGIHMPPEESCMYRDFDFLDRETQQSVHALPQPGAFIFNCWVEAWGRHVWFQPEPNDPNLAEVGMMDEKPAEGVLRINSEYPKDGFWWDSQLRITPGFPGGVHFLEPYAHALAEMDATRITRGGLFLDKAHTEALQRFAQAYRALPRRKFNPVGDTDDPVAVRMLDHEGRRYFYAVNREYYPIPATIRFNNAPKDLRDLASGETIAAPEEWPLLLEPYELRVFAMAPETDIVQVNAAPPAAIVQALNEEARRTLAAMEAARTSGKAIPGMDDLASRIREALPQGRVAFLRRALTSYIARKSQ